MVLEILIGLFSIFGLGFYMLFRARSIDAGGVQNLFAPKSLSSTSKDILTKYFKFYNLLPPKSKKIFEKRVARFVWLKEFVPREITTVTEEMQILIAASAIQLTFGFPQVFLSHFRYIIVYPDKFFSQSAQRYHKGEVNPKQKAIVLSWKHFVEGYAQSEGVNLGLHEMAHALQLENIIMNQEYDFLHPEEIGNWQLLADKEIGNIRSGTSDFFRPYGATNHHEFFAVAVENFFERPKEFISNHEDLYKCLANLLQQDPIQLYETL